MFGVASKRFPLVHCPTETQAAEAPMIRWGFLWLTGFSLHSACVPVRFQQQYGLALSEPEARECQEKPRVGELWTFSPEEASGHCRMQWDRVSKARRSGGLLAAVKECQIVAALPLVYTHESPTGVWFFLANILQSFASFQGANLKQMKRKQRKQFLRTHMPLVWYDCACILSRFVRAKKRCRHSNVARTLRSLKLVIDKFHFRKGHNGCKKGGRRPLKRVWPETHKKAFPRINDSAAEQSFAFLRKIAVAARRMTPVRGLLFVVLLQHERNRLLEHGAR